MVTFTVTGRPCAPANRNPPPHAPHTPAPPPAAAAAAAVGGVSVSVVPAGVANTDPGDEPAAGWGSDSDSGSGSEAGSRWCAGSAAPELGSGGAFGDVDGAAGGDVGGDEPAAAPGAAARLASPQS